MIDRHMLPSSSVYNERLINKVAGVTMAVKVSIRMDRVDVIIIVLAVLVLSLTSWFRRVEPDEAIMSCDQFDSRL